MVAVAEPARLPAPGEDPGTDNLHWRTCSVAFRAVWPPFFEGHYRPRHKCSRCALAVAEGNLGRTVRLNGSLEIRDLSRAFNQAGGCLESNKCRTAAYGDFREELQGRP